jgi:hypothetical protein
MVQSVLARAKPSDVVMEPYPHIVIKNALPEALADKLLAEFPTLDLFPNKINADNNASPEELSNRRLDLTAQLINQNMSISPTWKSIIAYHSSPEFLADFARVFRNAIERYYPHFGEGKDPLEKMSAGLMGRDENTDVEFLMNASIGVNTPVTTKVSRVRGVHIDRMHEMYAGLLYLRTNDDDSEGGDFEIHKFKGLRGFLKNEVPPNLTAKVTEVRYEHNTLVVFLNTIDSLHAVSPRSVTSSPRRFMIFSGVVATDPLINNSLYQIGNKPSDIRGASEPVGMGRLVFSRFSRIIEQTRNYIR